MQVIYAVVTREIRLFWLEIISVFYFTCNHVWNYFSRGNDFTHVEKCSWAATDLRNNVEIILRTIIMSDRHQQRLKWFWNNFISHVTTASVINPATDCHYWLPGRLLPSQLGSITALSQKQIILHTVLFYHLVLFYCMFVRDWSALL